MEPDGTGTTYTVNSDGSIKIEYPIIRQIIFEIVNHYGGENRDNIVIKDLDDTVKMLVKNGADINHKNNGGETALDIVKANKEQAIKNGRDTKEFDKIIKLLEK